MAIKHKINISKPTSAFVLILVGGIFVFTAGLMISIFGALFTLFMFGLGGIFGLFGIISGIVMIVSAFMINTTNKSQIKTWSVIALIFTCISIVNMGGFMIGFILGLIGSILGLVHEN